MLKSFSREREMGWDEKCAAQMFVFAPFLSLTRSRPREMIADPISQKICGANVVVALKKFYVFVLLSSVTKEELQVLQRVMMFFFRWWLGEERSGLAWTLFGVDDILWTAFHLLAVLGLCGLLLNGIAASGIFSSTREEEELCKRKIRNSELLLAYLALACVRMWDLRFVDWANFLLHPSNGQTYGRSPVWILTWVLHEWKQSD